MIDMTTSLGELEVLTDDECLAHLAAAEVGRVGVVVDGQPLVFPVNYVFEGGSVIVRTAFGTMLTGAALGLVAFEIDSFDAPSRSGWSVMVQGMGHDVTDALDSKSEHLQTVAVSPWAPGPRPRLLRIDARTITGRRFAGSPAV
jgi:nitroimidazol reductase NimA-like FMN-containing flavoprotein (pyridoxamine 5'-phosphate oxidase superfamily)